MPPFTINDSDTAPNPPLQKGDLRKKIGVSGTFNVGGFIRGEEYNYNLIGRRALMNYDIMSRSDATVHAGLQVCKLPILAANWMFKSPSDDPADQERTDLCNREFFDRNVDFYDVLSEGLTCLDFGYALGEIIYEPTTFNGQFKWGLQSLASRKQISVLNWQTQTGILGITQLAPYTDIPMRDIPMQKLFVFTNEKRGENYEGISLLRFAYKHWYLKDKLELMNAVALERMGLGIPFVKEDGTQTTMDAGEVQKVETALRQIRVNEEAYVKIPPGLEVGMLDFDASKVKDILPTLYYEDEQILLSVLAQFLGLGQGAKGGSRALSDDHSKLFLLSLQAVSRIMQRGLQSVAKRLIDLNYSPDNLPNGYPKLEFEDLDDDNVAEISLALQQLVDGGVITPGLDVENRARRTVDIQELTQEDWNKIQADKQLKAQQAAQQAQALAEKQASLQPGVQQTPAPKPEPEQDLTDPEENEDPTKTKKPNAKPPDKEDKLISADRAVDELYKQLAEV